MSENNNESEKMLCHEKSYLDFAPGYWGFCSCLQSCFGLIRRQTTQKWRDKRSGQINVLVIRSRFLRPSKYHRDKSRRSKTVIITVIITAIIMIITVNLTVINTEPRTILYGVINAVKPAFIAVLDKYGLP